MGDWGGAGKGAAGGGLTGASIGTAILPGWGTAIGAGVGAIGGGLMGFFSGGDHNAGMSDADRAYYHDYLGSVRHREALQLAGPASQAQASDFRGNQNSLISQLEAAASGRGPSLAAEQIKSSSERIQRGQQAFANSARGSGATLARYQAANNMANLGAQATQDSAAARIAEITAAQNQLGLTLHGARAADEQLSQFNAQAQNAAAMANLEAALKSRGMDDEAIARYFATMQNSPQVASQGDALLSGGISAAAAYAQQRAARQTTSQAGLGGTGRGEYVPGQPYDSPLPPSP